MPWMYASILICGSFLALFCRSHALLKMVETAISIRNSCMTSVYHKATRLSSKALSQIDTGNMVILMSTDSMQMVQVGRWLAIGMLAPLDIIGVLIFLGFIVGPAACVMIAVMVVSLPINGVVAKRFFAARAIASPLTDKRLKSSSEFVKFIRAIKYYAWELFFVERIEQCRENEMKEIARLNYLRSYLLQISQAVGSVGLLLVLMTYSLLGNPMDPATAFTAFRLIQMLRLPFIMLPVAITSLGMLKNSFGRLTEFLKLPELDPTAVDRTVEPGVVQIDGNFSWGDKLQLKDVSVAFPKGKLTMVVGQVGSGKSSLLHALLGDMERDDKSRVAVGGRVAYAAQTAFVVNDTLRNNVLFGLPYEEEKYETALRASDLESDLKLLPGGDLTEIGERGINLSGGQKQRVALARCLYADADVVMLDDCLSAVDAHVGEHIFRQAIQGVLADKTVILVSNQLPFLPSADYIVAIEDGMVREQGEYKQLMERGKEFSKLIETFGVHADDEEQRKEDAAADLAKEAELYKQKMLEREEEKRKMLSNSSGLKKSLSGDTDSDRELAGRLVLQEDTSESNYVDMSVYWKYITSGGVLRWVVSSLSLVVCACAQYMPGLWLGFWSTLAFGYGNDFYIGILGLLSFCEMFFYFVGAGISVQHGTAASKTLHTAYVDKLGHARISFYDTTPTGRVLNRLSKDMDDVDVLLSFQFHQYVRNWANLLVLCALIAYASPWLLFAIVPLGVVFWAYLRFYRRTSVRLQRIESITLSPIFQHFSETLPGLSTIRAFDLIDAECDRSFRYINADSLAEFALRVVDNWLGIRLDLIVAVCTIVVCFVMIGLKDSVSAATAGYAINYVLASVNVLSFFSQNLTQMETVMNAVERIDMFTKRIPLEAPFDDPDNKPSPEWPQKGVIEFKEAEFCYREGLPPVLKNLTLEIEGGSKVGIVGRTGAGKSSILVVLLRMAELSHGSIVIDGVDISKIGLHDLRSRVGIIPQEPTLFTGTIRTNLDPFAQYTNEDLWRVLRQAQLVEFVERDGGLEAPVTEDGGNYSLGQRQLLCMARALLRRPKILLMDEATASVDMENDVLIQETVRKEFENSTVLTIAHRLHTVADSDVVMVLEKGKLAEMDKPEKLVAREQSHFKSLIQATGPSSSAHLMNFILHEKKLGKTAVNLLELEAIKNKKKNVQKTANAREEFGDMMNQFDRTGVSIMEHHDIKQKKRKK